MDEGIAQANSIITDQTLGPIDSQVLRQRIDELNQFNRDQSKEGKCQLKELEKYRSKLKEYEGKLDP